MRHLSNFLKVFGVSFTLFTAPVVFADEAVSVKEADALIKDDIANAQVLIEMCPALIGKNAKFDQNIKKMVGTYLSNYSDKSASLESLQKDAEFKSLLKDAHEAATEVDKTEQKAVCEEVLNFEG
ncbi:MULTISPECIES: MCR_0457 family protein [Acinetobacter]|uniref:MCR_0457 family protein n=1 Tax=Acinetobacter TaxID=469 RepID=UPI000F4EB96E|nr:MULTISPECIES: hypothetical protein [Acinetobacter]MEB6479434.1 hypothetical protein [Acinetobacter vivianii]MEB6656736.1 hypothetical protein [Acinetobacter vivianii]RPE30793.1 hypothetical protein EC846_1493 [Acinetobacter sp. BIGb0102]